MAWGSGTSADGSWVFAARRYTQHALERTLYILERREVIRFSGGKKTVHRIGV